MCHDGDTHIGLLELIGLLALVDELVEAHEATVRLLLEGADAERWGCHADYLRALQRHGRRALAETGAAA
jgi:hypothetical protein